MDARPILVAVGDAGIVDRVNAEVQRQLATLPTAPVARQAVASGFAVLARDIDDAIALRCPPLLTQPPPPHTHTAAAATVAARAPPLSGVASEPGTGTAVPPAAATPGADVRPFSSCPA